MKKSKTHCQSGGAVRQHYRLATGQGVQGQQSPKGKGTPMGKGKGSRTPC